ncbi:MAG: outer membrane beta-barrel protein [Ignavibacteriales bacterium]
MKKILTILVLSVLIISASSNSSQAQFRLKLGPQVGMNFNLHTGSDIESGNGFGFVIGGTVDMSFTPTIGLITNMQFYDNRSGSRTEESTRNYRDQQTGASVTSNVSVENSVSLAYFLIEPLFKLNLPNSGFYFVMGPSVGFNVEGSGEQTTSETFPPAYANNNTKETAKIKYNDLLARFELKLGAGLDIPIASGLYLTPQVSFGYGITNVMSDIAWRVLTAQALVAVKFNLL